MDRMMQDHAASVEMFRLHDYFGDDYEVLLRRETELLLNNNQVNCFELGEANGES